MFKNISKRFVLGLIAALVFSPFAAIAPASADDASNAEIGAITASDPATGRVGNALLSTLTIGAASGSSIADNDDLRLRALMLSKPVGSTAVVSFSAANTSASFDTHVVTAAGASGNELLPARMTLKANDAITNDAKAAGSVGLIPDVIGDYEVRVWNDTDNDGLKDADEDSVDIDFTVGSAAASVTVTAVSGASIATISPAGADGALVRLNLLDAAGLSAGLAGNESITLTGPSTMTFPKVNNSASVGFTTSSNVATLNAAAFVSGYAYVNMKNTAAATTTVTISSTGITPAISGTFTQIYRTQVLPNTAFVGTSTLVTSSTSTTAAAYGSTSTIGVAGASNDVDIPVGSKTLNYLISITSGLTTDAAAAQTLYFENNIDDNSGHTTGSFSANGVTGLEYDRAVTLTQAAAATSATGRFTVTTTAPSVSENLVTSVVALPSQPSVEIDSIATTSGTPTVSPAGAISLQTGGTITYVVTAVDNFGRVLPSASVLMTGGTRNAIVTPIAAVTSELGEAVFTRTDAPAAGVTSLTDTFTFSVSYAGASATTVNSGAITWSATGPAVATVTFTLVGTEDDTASSITYRDINAGSTGAQAGAAAIGTITVKDAAGNLLTGVPVTLTTTSAGAAVVSTSATLYTGAAGTVTTANVYGWTAGAKTFTATSGGKTATATVNYRQETPTEARTVSAALVGKLATVTVKDRFGNPVKDVNILGTRTGSGYFGNGSTTATGTTDKDGVASFVVEGVGTFTFSATTTLGVADTLYGQTCAAVGKTSCASTALAVTAFKAGTSTVAETGVGDTFAPAGVNAATVTTTAVVPVVVYDKPTLQVTKVDGKVLLSGTAVEGEGDIIVYLKRVGTTKWVEQAATIEVAAPGDFNGLRKAPKFNVLVRVKQEGTGLFSNQVVVRK